MAADSLKLIAYGKVMEDDAKTLKDYSIKEGDFLVVMVTKVSSRVRVTEYNRLSLLPSLRKTLSKRKLALLNNSPHLQPNRIHQFKLNLPNSNNNSPLLNSNLLLVAMYPLNLKLQSTN